MKYHIKKLYFGEVRKDMKINRKYLVIGLIILFIGASVLPAITRDVSAGDLSNGLVAYWSFDDENDVGHDDSGNGHQGTNHGATSISNGISGRAMSFDGIDDYIDITDTSDFEFANQDLTFSTWVQIVDNANQYRNIVVLGDANDNYPNIGMVKARSGYDGGRLYGQLYPSAPGGQYVYVSTIDDGDTLPKNEWLFLTFVFDYENSLCKLYLNGVFQDVDDLPSYDLTVAQSLELNIGRCPWQDPWWHGYFNGCIDEVRIYNRALSEDEIQYLYDYPCGINQPPVADAGGPYEANEGEEITFDASGSSDPDLILFDDFETWDPSRWKTYNDPTVSVLNGELTLTDTKGWGVAGFLVSKMKIPQGTRITIRFKQVQNYWRMDSQYAGLVEDTGTSVNERNRIFAWDSPYQNYWRFWTQRDGSPHGWIYLGGCPDVYDYHTIEYVWDNDLAEYYFDGVLKATRTVNVPYIDLPVVFRVQEYNSIVIDWVEVTRIGGVVGPLQYRWDFDNDGTWDTSYSTDPTASYNWYDDHSGEVKVEVSDGVATDTDTATVTVNNVAPTITSLDLPLDPVPIGTAVSLTATFTDPGWLDTHIATIDWDDGNITSGYITGSDGTYTVTDSWTYAQAGVYTITLTVTDDDNGTDIEIFQYVVIYNLEDGFVTGGGWIESPEGAYTPNPNLTGKANFGFVSKYKKGQQQPTGNTEFNFKMADLNFHSDDYDWLVIAGAKAMYKGTGTINGSGNYGFLLSAVDEELTQSTDVDLFRIKIWDKDNDDEIIYDNMLGEDEDADPTTAIGGGNIKIHEGE